MTTTAPARPAPPPDLRTWSLMTIAAYVCVSPSTAYVALCPFIRAHGVGATFGTRRAGHHFELRSDDDTSGVSVTDCHLSDAAVAHLVAAFPAGVEARRVVAAGPLWPGEQSHRIATFLVEHHGGGLPTTVGPALRGSVPAPRPSATFDKYGTVIRDGSS